MSIAQRLVLALLDLGVTQVEIAQRSGLSQPTVSSIANGTGSARFNTQSRIMAVAAGYAKDISAYRDTLVAEINAAVDAQVKELTCNR